MQNKSLDLAPPPMKSWAPPPRPNQPEMSQLERYIERRNRPSRTRGGETDVFTSAIAGILERAKPTFPGVGGQVVIEFVVSETGRMEGLRLAQSSGQPKLDDLVLRSVARVQLVPPPAGTTLRDRTFEITYSYK